MGIAVGGVYFGKLMSGHLLSLSRCLLNCKKENRGEYLEGIFAQILGPQLAILLPISLHIKQPSIWPLIRGKGTNLAGAECELERWKLENVHSLQKLIETNLKDHIESARRALPAWVDSPGLGLKVLSKMSSVFLMKLQTSLRKSDKSVSSGLVD